MFSLCALLPQSKKYKERSRIGCASISPNSRPKSLEKRIRFRASKVFFGAILQRDCSRRGRRSRQSQKFQQKNTQIIRTLIAHGMIDLRLRMGL